MVWSPGREVHGAPWWDGESEDLVIAMAMLQCGYGGARNETDV